MYCQSDALYWNLSQIDNVGKLGRKAIKSYSEISKRLDVEMHSAIGWMCMGKVRR